MLLISSLGITSKLAISMNAWLISIEFVGNFIPSMRGSCTTIYWLLIILQNWFKEVCMIILTAALLLETNVVVSDMESPIFVKVIASAAELNCSGISLFFITVGGSV